MKLYLVLKTVNKQIGTRKEETYEYKQYMNRKNEIEQDDGWGLGFKFSSTPPEKYRDAPVFISVPIIVEISVIDPTLRYKKFLLPSDKLPFGAEHNLVWIEEIEVLENEIHHYSKLSVANIVDEKMLSRQYIDESLTSSQL